MPAPREVDHSLPAVERVEHHRKAAKELLRAARAGQADAVGRLQDSARRLRGELRLADAQRVIAREHGHSSWAAFRRDIERQANEPERSVARIGPASSGSASRRARRRCCASWPAGARAHGAGCVRTYRASLSSATPRSAQRATIAEPGWSSRANTGSLPGEGWLRGCARNRRDGSVHESIRNPWQRRWPRSALGTPQCSSACSTQTPGWCMPRSGPEARCSAR